MKVKTFKFIILIARLKLASCYNLYSHMCEAFFFLHIYVCVSECVYVCVCVCEKVRYTSVFFYNMNKYWWPKCIHRQSATSYYQPRSVK